MYTPVAIFETHENKHGLNIGNVDFCHIHLYWVNDNKNHCESGNDSTVRQTYTIKKLITNNSFIFHYETLKT